MTSNDDATQGAGQDAAAPTAGAISNLNQAEQFIGLGAVIIVLADLIGGVFLAEYGLHPLLWLAAVVALAALWAGRMRSLKSPLGTDWVLVVSGFAAGLFGLRVLLGDLIGYSASGSGGRFNIFDAGGGTIVFALLTWVGAALMALGAYRASKS